MRTEKLGYKLTLSALATALIGSALLVGYGFFFGPAWSAFGLVLLFTSAVGTLGYRYSNV